MSNETLCDYLSQDHNQDTVINICNKDKTIVFSDKFKDILFWLIYDYLPHNIVDKQEFYDPIEDKSIIFITLDINSKVL